MHNRLPPRFPIFSLSALVNPVPGTNFPGFGKPLYAHVRNIDDGGEWTESQDGG